jgi:hypothetical protein
VIFRSFCKKTIFSDPEYFGAGFRTENNKLCQRRSTNGVEYTFETYRKEFDKLSILLVVAYSQ